MYGLTPEEWKSIVIYCPLCRLNTCDPLKKGLNECPKCNKEYCNRCHNKTWECCKDCGNKLTRETGL